MSSLPQEVRHQLKESQFFSEVDMNHGFHQLPLSQEASKCSVFQTHEGKHSQVTSDAPRETEEGPVTGAQEEIHVQAEPSGTVRPGSRRKEKWSFESPTTWQPSAQSRPMTSSVSARREMEKGRIRGRDR